MNPALILNLNCLFLQFCKDCGYEVVTLNFHVFWKQGIFSFLIRLQFLKIKFFLLMQPFFLWHTQCSHFCVISLSVTVTTLSPFLSALTFQVLFHFVFPKYFFSLFPTLPLPSLCSLNETQICQVAMSQCLPGPLFFCLLVNYAIVFTSTIPINDSNSQICWIKPFHNVIIRNGDE